MRAVNLLPRQQVQGTRERPNVVVLVAAIGGATVLLALVGGFLLANRSANRERQDLANARAILAVTPAHHLSASTQAFRSKVLNDKEQRSLALDAAIGKRVAWDRILRRFALVLPSDVWLTNLSGSVPLDNSAATATAVPTGPLPATPTALTISGYTYSQDSVARLLERLSVVPDLENVQLQNSQTAQVSGQNVIQFTIVSDVRKGRGAS